jgi:pimeloyl-ACP methyl ester carboxylesterase
MGDAGWLRTLEGDADGGNRRGRGAGAWCLGRRIELALLAATQRPLAAACIGVPVRHPLWKDRPSWFLVAEEDRMIPAATQRFMAERMKARVRTAAADHMPMITATPVVVDMLLEAAREVKHSR